LNPVRACAALPAAAAAAVLESAPFGACVLRDGRIVHANRWLRELACGAGGPDDPAPLLDLVHPEDRALAAEELERSPDAAAQAPPSVRLRDREGGWRVVELRACAVALDDGPAVQATLVDVTERARGEARLRERAADLEEANRLRRIFGDVLTHDLTNPVWVAENYLILALDGGVVPEPRLPLCEAMRGALAKARRILNDARTYLKVLELPAAAPETVDLGVLAAGAAESLRALADAKGQRVSVTVEGTAAAQADPLLQEALWQLIANAVKYGPADGEIEVLVRGGDAVRLEVRDRGPGVPAADRERIFHRYERVDKGPIAGVGLGLSIATRILRLHGGSLRVEDNPGGGSRFIAEIPPPASG
jgi:signal transduction histidine kinase